MASRRLCTMSPPPPTALRSLACERNRQPILDVLLRVLPSSGSALEIASGTGQHAAWFALHLPRWHWQPSDLDDTGFASILAWRDHLVATNMSAPLVLDVTQARWPAQGPELAAGSMDAIFCANMLHIAPWAACAGLMQGAARYLRPTGLLLTYGPYLEADAATAPSNLSFDASLRQRNPAWGIRAREEVAKEAAAAGLRLRERVPMPANNLVLVWER